MLPLTSILVERRDADPRCADYYLLTNSVHFRVLRVAVNPDTGLLEGTAEGPVTGCLVYFRQTGDPSGWRLPVEVRAAVDHGADTLDLADDRHTGTVNTELLDIARSPACTPFTVAGRR